MGRVSGRHHIGAILICGLVGSLELGGCADTEAQRPEGAESVPSVTVCTDPRPEFCTREYIPVCATLRDGARQTYASGCTACADANVVSYQPKECE